MGFHSGTNGFRIVVFTLVQGRTTMIADPSSERRPSLRVENGFAFQAGPASAEPRNDAFQWKLVIQYRIKRDALRNQDLFQSLSLRHGAWKSIQQEATTATKTARSLSDQLDDCIVGHQFSASHAIQRAFHRRA